MRGTSAGWLVPIIHSLGIVVEVLLRILMIERFCQLVKSIIPPCAVPRLKQVVGGILPQSQPLPALSWTTLVDIRFHTHSTLWPIGAFFRIDPICAGFYGGASR